LRVGDLSNQIYVKDFRGCHESSWFAFLMKDTSLKNIISKCGKLAHLYYIIFFLPKNNIKQIIKMICLQDSIFFYTKFLDSSFRMFFANLSKCSKISIIKYLLNFLYFDTWIIIIIISIKNKVHMIFFAFLHGYL